jgi:hypothetical protein
MYSINGRIEFYIYIFILNSKTMKNFFLLVTIILSFNLSAQLTLSGGGVRVIFPETLSNMTVKWTNSTNNQVVTKSAILTGPVYLNYQKYAQYKVKNSSDYFLLRKGVMGGYSIGYYNELGSLYWECFVI